MKKLFAVVFAMVLLILAGCRLDAGQPADTTNASENTAPSTAATQPSTEPTQGTTEPEPTDAPSPDHYSMAPTRYIIFKYDGKVPNKSSPLFYANVDVSGCKVGQTYEYDRVTRQIRLIGRDISVWEETSEHFYYVYHSDFSKLYRSAYGKTEDALVAVVEGGVAGVSYYGVNAFGKLIVVEDSKRVWLFDLQTGASELLMEQYYVMATIRYTPDKDATGKDCYALHWHGQVNEDDPITTYVYYIDTKENIAAPWN